MTVTAGLPGARRTGERMDFDAFVRARSGALLRSAYLLTHDHGLAQDLVQTALTKAWLAWRRIEGDPEPYVRRVLFNTFATSWRRRWRGERVTSDPPDPVVSDRTEAAGAGHDLWEAMGRLPRRQRAVVVLRYYEDRTEAETAELLGISPGTVKSQLSKALAKLRVDPALQDDDGTEAR